MQSLTQEEHTIINLFDKPKFITICGDRHSGKSNFIAHIIETLNKAGAKYNLRTYGLPEEFSDLSNNVPVHSIEQLEEIEDSIIIIDEAAQLLDVENRANKVLVENFLRLLNHRNNICILCFLPENLRKFLSSKVDVHLFKKCTIQDCINGSFTKRVIQSYSGPEKGSFVLSLNKDEALVYNHNTAERYRKISIPYYQDYDTKRRNKPIVTIPEEAKSV